jgi:hypothetical protein
MSVAGALVGGVLAALLVDLETGTTIVITAVAVVVGVVIAVLLVDTRAPAPPATPGPPAPQRRSNDWWTETPNSPTTTPPLPASAAPTQQIPQPQRMVLGTGRGGQWWEKAGTPTAAAPAKATPGAPVAPELTSYVESARVVQCPRCGAFRIDVSRSAAGFAFHCTVDGHRWTWRPGAAWPATVVVSRRRTRI